MERGAGSRDGERTRVGSFECERDARAEHLSISRRSAEQTEAPTRLDGGLPRRVSRINSASSRASEGTPENPVVHDKRRRGSHVETPSKIHPLCNSGAVSDCPAQRMKVNECTDCTLFDILAMLIRPQASCSSNNSSWVTFRSRHCCGVDRDINSSQGVPDSK